MLELRILLLITIGGLCVYWAFHNPYHFPYKIIEIDVTGKRSPTHSDALDRYLIACRMAELEDHNFAVERWKEKNRKKAKKSIFRAFRLRQYQKSLDEEHAFRFRLIRFQTRYRQVNYEKYPYQVKVIGDSFSCSYECIEKRFHALEEIEFSCTLNDYNAKNQRRLMTKALRKQIAERDKYTCQICGKKMEDGVGLQIDHIVPVSKGGKSVPSNLQTLCSVCNGRKSDN